MASDSEYTRLYRCEVISPRPAATSEWMRDALEESGHTKAEGRWFVADLPCGTGIGRTTTPTRRGRSM